MRGLGIGGAPPRMRQARIDLGDRDVELALPFEQFARMFIDLRILARRRHAGRDAIWSRHPSRIGAEDKTDYV